MPAEPFEIRYERGLLVWKLGRALRDPTGLGRFAADERRRPQLELPPMPGPKGEL